MSERRADGPGFVRDSLAFHIGMLAREALRRAFTDELLVQMYADWLSGTPCHADCESSCKHYATLLEFGLSSGGIGMLHAHRRASEFQLTCQHDGFEFVALLSFDPPSIQLEGLLVAHFNGDPAQALRWVQAATTEVGRAQFGGDGDACLERLN